LTEIILCNELSREQPIELVITRGIVPGWVGMMTRAVLPLVVCLKRLR
jgi:hypothetical protein